MKTLSVSTYAALREKIRNTLLLGQQKIDQARVQTYWQTGVDIHAHILCHKERADYGDGVMERLAGDLAVGSRLLERALKFYRGFPKIPSTWTELSWSHFRALLAVPDERKRFALAGQAAKNGWVSRDLEIKIRNLLWDERVAKTDGKAPSLLSVPALGAFFTYKIIKPEIIHSKSNELLIDLGFSTVLELNRITDHKYKPDDIVTSFKDSRGSYKLSAIGSGLDELYTYQAFVERVVDGDTLKVEIDLGFNIRIRQTLRLRGIDCSEIDTAEGKVAKRFVENALAGLEYITLKSTRTLKEKWGRYLGDIFYADKAGKQQYLNNLLLEKVMAVRVRE